MIFINDLHKKTENRKFIPISIQSTNEREQVKKNKQNFHQMNKSINLCSYRQMGKNNQKNRTKQQTIITTEWQAATKCQSYFLQIVFFRFSTNFHSDILGNSIPTFSRSVFVCKLYRLLYTHTLMSGNSYLNINFFSTQILQIIFYKS